MALGRNKNRYREAQSVDNAAKTLLANIRFMSVDNPVRAIAITSAVPNEGKTFVAANLARAIATSGERALLVECDMRRRSMAGILGTHAAHGLYSVMSGQVPLLEAAVITDVPNLYFLDAEPHIPNPSDLINSQRFASLVASAREIFDYVVFDTPPVGTFVDAAVLGTKVDAVFMVVREGFTKRAEILAAADQLEHAGCNLAGVVMNCCERTSSEYYYEYYYTRGEAAEESAPQLADVPRAADGQRAHTGGGSAVRGATARATQVMPEVPQHGQVSAAQQPAVPQAQRAGGVHAASQPMDTGEYVALAEQLAARNKANASADAPRD